MFKKIIYIIRMRWKYHQCHKAAFILAKLGQKNNPIIQEHLNNAKDSVYYAALEFKEESESVS